MRALDLDKYGIRRVRRPQVQGGLMSTVITPEGYVDVTFNRELVRRAGKVLERGVAAHDPAYMELIKDGDLWIIYVRYVTDTQPAYRKKLLWSVERPSWSKNSKKIDQAIMENGEKGENHEGHPQ